MNEGNYNSEIGLPIACFSVDAGHSYAVFEMAIFLAILAFGLAYAWRKGLLQWE